MKKRYMALILCLCMVAALAAGCNKNKSESTGKSGEKVTISYACWDNNQATLLQKVADDFEKDTGIHIDIQLNGWNDYWTALEAAGTAGSLPDTFWMHSNNIYYYESNNQLLDLNKYIKASDKVDLSNYPEGLNQIYNLDGKQYAIPKDYDTIGLWYNKPMFDEAGVKYPDDTWTWDDLKEAAKKLTKADGSQYGFLAGLHNQEGYYNFVYQNGGTIVTSDKKSGYDDPKTVEAMDYYFNFVREGISPVVTDDGERAEDFKNGLVAMAFFGSWNLSGFAADENLSKNCDVAVLPKANNGGRASIYNGLGNAIAVNTKHPDEAWRWVEYLSSKEGQLKQAQLGVAISAFNGTASDWTKAYPQFNVKCYIDMVDYAQIRPYTNQTSIWEDKAYQCLNDVYTNGGDVAAACKDTADMMNKAISEEK